MRLLLGSGVGVETGGHADTWREKRSRPSHSGAPGSRVLGRGKLTGSLLAGGSKGVGGRDGARRAARRSDGTGACDHLQVFGFHTE